MLLTPVSWAYAFAAAHRLQTTVSRHAPIPVVCVGNFTVGGAGKTPITRALRAKLGDGAHTLSRGYGGAQKGPLQVDLSQHTAADVGDEPLMMAADGPMWISVDRVQGARAAVAASQGGQVDAFTAADFAAYYLIAPAEASSNLARFDGVRYGLRVDGEDGLEAMYSATRAAGFGAEAKRRIMLGTYALSSGYYDAYYGRAQKVRTKISEDFRTAFERFDFVVTPTAPGVAFPLGSKVDDPLAMYLSDYCTVPMSLAGIPAISIPAGLSEGLPVGFQIAGPAFSEGRLLSAAAALETAIGFDGSPARAGGGA